MKNFNYLLVAILITGVSFSIGDRAYNGLAEKYSWSDTAAWPIAFYLLLMGVFVMSLFIVPKWKSYGPLYMILITLLWIAGVVVGLG